MEMRFSVGSGVTFGFSTGGSYQPEPVSDGRTPFGSPVVTDKGFGKFHVPENTPFGLPIIIINYTNGVGYYKTGNNGAAATSITLASPGKTNVNATSLAIMMYRSTKTFSVDGYSLVTDSNVIQMSGYYQQISAYKKTLVANDIADSLTVSQTDSVRLDILNVILSGSNITFTLVDNALVASLPYTPPAKTGKRRLYVMSSALAVNDNEVDPTITLSAAGLAMQSGGFNRLKIWYDYDQTVDVTPTLIRDTSVSPDSYTANSAVLLTFDVEGSF